MLKPKRVQKTSPSIPTTPGFRMRRHRGLHEIATNMHLCNALTHTMRHHTVTSFHCATIIAATTEPGTAGAAAHFGTAKPRPMFAVQTLSQRGSSVSGDLALSIPEFMSGTKFRGFHAKMVRRHAPKGSEGSCTLCPCTQCGFS